MNTPKSFKVGDKVFAKVKGYPAWPAEVVSLSGNKYDVKFYGTGETGSLKPDDLFYYLKHKGQLIKALKRRDYTNAVDEIEEVISSTGTDGDPEPEDNSDESALQTRKGVKRKRSVSRSSDTSNRSKISRKSLESRIEIPENAAETESKQVVGIECPMEAMNYFYEEDELYKDAEQSEEVFERNDDAYANFNEVEVENEMNGNSPRNEEILMQEDDNSSLSELSDFERDDSDSGQFSCSETIELDTIRLIPEVYLSTLITYAQHVRDKQDKYKAKAPDSGNFDHINDAKTKVLAVKLPSGAFVGIKFMPKNVFEFSSEYDCAMDNEKLAKEVLELKMNLEEGKLDATDADEGLMLYLKSSENEIYETINRMIIDYKNEKLKMMHAEIELYDSIINIRNCLSIEMARPKMAIRLLETIELINVTTFSLRKYPPILATIGMLRRYIGNITCWHLDRDRLAVFADDARVIRDLATLLFDKFRALFPYKDDENFMDKFKIECREFRHNLKGLTQTQKFSLCAEPYSRRSFLDEAYDDLKPGKVTI